MEHRGRGWQGRILTPCDAWNTLPNKESPLLSATGSPSTQQLPLHATPTKSLILLKSIHLSSPVPQGPFPEERVSACHSLPGLLAPFELKAICPQLTDS